MGADEVTRFLEATRDHRWAIGFRLGVLYGLRRREVLALGWDDLDTDAKALRVDQSLVAVNKGAAWSDAKNERSRRRIPLDDETLRSLARRRGAGIRATPRRTGDTQRVQCPGLASRPTRMVGVTVDPLPPGEAAQLIEAVLSLFQRCGDWPTFDQLDKYADRRLGIPDADRVLLHMPEGVVSKDFAT